jgi:CO/xanthine dehydrogenase Mo-binding subunit
MSPDTALSKVVLPAPFAPKVWWDKERGCGDAYFHYVYGASAAIVKVDTETAEVSIIKQVSAHDVGIAINPAEVIGQISGGIAMGQGYALLEDVKLKEGIVNTKNLDTYLIPTSMDVSECVPIIVEHPDDTGPFGARGLGEPATQTVAPAIVNAVSDAINTRVYRIPLDLEEMMRVLRGCGLSG